jgi:hypothetical protein
MKRFFILFSFVIFAVCALYPLVIKNPDNPLKGKWDFKCEKIWQLEGYNDDLLAQVHQVSVHDNGDIYLFDRTHFKFFVFDKSGKPKFTFGKKGEGPGEIKVMLGFFQVGNNIIVSDMGKIHYFGLDGKYLKSISTSSTIGMAPLLFIDENRLVKTRPSLDILSGTEALEIFNLIAKTTLYLDGKPVPDDQKNVDRGTRIIIRAGNSGNESRISYVAGKAPGKLLWGKNDTYLIRSCDYSGKEQLAFSVEGRKLKKITREFKEKSVARMRIRTSGEPSVEEIKKRMMSRIPDESTYFSQIETGANGLIYVYVSDAVRENGRGIDIFSQAGKYLYQADIDFPEAQVIAGNGLVFKGDFLYVLVEEKSGDLSFRKYSIKNPQK